MIFHVFKTRRCVGGRVVPSKNYFGALCMDWESKESRWSLGTSDEREAWRRLDAERIRREKERHGLLPPREQAEARETPLNEHLEAFLSDMRDLGRTKTTLKTYRSLLVLFDRCGWRTIPDVTQRSFCEWRSTSRLADEQLFQMRRNFEIQESEGNPWPTDEATRRKWFRSAAGLPETASDQETRVAYITKILDPWAQTPEIAYLYSAIRKMTGRQIRMFDIDAVKIWAKESGVPEELVKQL